MRVGIVNASADIGLVRDHIGECLVGGIVMNVQHHSHDHVTPMPMPGMIGRPSEEQIMEENFRLKGEVQRMAERQNEVMKLLNCRSAERIVHDLRNLMNELNLYKSLMENEV